SARETSRARAAPRARHGPMLRGRKAPLAHDTSSAPTERRAIAKTATCLKGPVTHHDGIGRSSRLAPACHTAHRNRLGYFGLASLRRAIDIAAFQASCSK